MYAETDKIEVAVHVLHSELKVVKQLTVLKQKQD